MNLTGYEDQIVADYYDYAQPLKSRDDVDFFVNQAKQCGGDVLELGCGTGRVLIPTAENGVHITGIDLSSLMLDQCRKKINHLPADIQSRITLHHSNMASFNLNQQFDLITIPFRAFHHLITIEDQLSCLECVHHHIKPNGLFILDLFNPILQRLLDEKSVAIEFEEPEMTLPDGRIVKRIQRNQSPKPNLQTVHCHHTYHITETSGETHTFTTSYPMRYFFRYEVEHLLARSGFGIEAVYCDFQKNPLDEFKPGEMIFMSRLLS